MNQQQPDCFPLLLQWRNELVLTHSKVLLLAVAQTETLQPL
jgi:hypothetical protein